MKSASWDLYNVYRQGQAWQQTDTQTNRIGNPRLKPNLKYRLQRIIYHPGEGAILVEEQSVFLKTVYCRPVIEKITSRSISLFSYKKKLQLYLDVAVVSCWTRKVSFSTFLLPRYRSQNEEMKQKTVTNTVIFTIFQTTPSSLSYSNADFIFKNTLMTTTITILGSSSSKRYHHHHHYHHHHRHYHHTQMHVYHYIHLQDISWWLPPWWLVWSSSSKQHYH